MPPRWVAASLALQMLAACGGAPAAYSGQGDSPAQVEQLLDQWTVAFEKKDVTGVMAVYSPDLTAYDIVGPFQYRGAAAYGDAYRKFFAQFAGHLRSEDRDVHIDVSGDLAVAYGLERVTGQLKNDTTFDVWMRFTLGLRKTSSGWRITHEHISLPTNTEAIIARRPAD